jgi:hypothetical protein
MTSLTPDLKVSTVEKNHNIKPATLCNSKHEYKAYDDKDMSKPKNVEDMVRSISQLDKKSHEEIYLTIRKFKPQKFFASNSIDTRFNIYGLSVEERIMLSRTIDLCKENMERNEVISNAASIHQEELAKLEDRIGANNPILIDDLQNNPSEREKIKEMLQMHN